MVTAILNAVVLASAVAFARQQVLRAHLALACGANLALLTGGIWWATSPRPDLKMRINALGEVVTDWSWLRWEFAVPVLANVGLLLVTWWSLRQVRCQALHSFADTVKR